MNPNWSRNAFVYLLIIVAAAALFINVYQPGETPERMSLTQLAKAIQEGTVETLVVRDEELQRQAEGERRHARRAARG